jgi:hypothetical protein
MRGVKRTGAWNSSSPSNDEAEAKMIRLRLVPTTFAIAFAITVFAGRAAAQDQAAIDKLVQMNKKALDDYDTLEWESAKNTLLDALRAGKKAGLDNHPVMARTYVHLGAVYITGFKNRDKALQSFTRALEIDPGIQLSKGIATTEVNDVFAEAKRARGGGGGGETTSPAKKRRGPVMEGSEEAPTPEKKKKQAAMSTSDDESEEKDLPVKITALDCPNEDEAILDRPATLRCALAKTPTLAQVAKVYLMYQEPGKDAYTELQMTKSPKGWYVAKIPKKAVAGKSIRYYFEGRNASGKPIVRNGEESDPQILLLMTEENYRARKKRPAPGEEPEENPLERPEGPYTGPRFKLGQEDVTKKGLDVRFGNRKWWIGLGAGSGFGFAKGDGLEAVNRSPETTLAPGDVPMCGRGEGFHDLASCFQPGGAWAGLFHLAPEIGVHLNSDWAISVEGRLQYIPQPAQYAKYASRGAISGLFKVMRYTKQAKIRFFVSGIAGGGEGFRFTVKPATAANCNNTNPDALCKVQDFTDTIRGGPAIAGGGVGLYYEASKRAAIVLEAHGLAGFPVFSFVVDGNLALQINFYSETKKTTESEGRYIPKEEDEEPK